MANDDDRLPDKVKRKLARMKREQLHVLDISLWEAGRVYRHGALTDFNVAEWFELATGAVTVVPISSSIAICEQGLGWEHRDPADRLIVAAATVMGMPLVTVDERVSSFAGVRCVAW